MALDTVLLVAQIGLSVRSFGHLLNGESTEAALYGLASAIPLTMILNIQYL